MHMLYYMQTKLPKRENHIAKGGKCSSLPPRRNPKEATLIASHVETFGVTSKSYI